ncbi:MAG: sugar kinase [Armatimonadota bacterium]
MNSNVDVVVVGSCLVEMTPVATGTQLTEASQYRALPSGSASNFAAALGRLGVATGFITRVGDDELGQWLLAKLREFGVRTEGFAGAVEGQLTPVSFCWMDQQGEKTFYFYRFENYCDPMGALDASGLSTEVIGRGRIFDFTEAAIRQQPLRGMALAAARNAREAGLEVAYAANYRPSSWSVDVEKQMKVQHTAFASADIVLMNREEAMLFTPRDTVEGAAEFVASLGPKIVAITDGDSGAYVYSDGIMHEIAARRVKVEYDIGAGDTFHAGFLAAYLDGRPPKAMGRFAADAAALRISRSAQMECLPAFDEVDELTKQPT